MKALCLVAFCVFPLAAAGCSTYGWGAEAERGLVVYVPGAGNVDRGDVGLREGLAQAGYTGQFATLTWTATYNVAIDQSVRAFARLGSKRLAGLIQDYADRYPGREINIVSLSAGTGIAVWALEDLREGYAVNNVVLLGSSLSRDYDVTRALRRIKGKIYNYYSMEDAVLVGPMKVFGTIDGKLFADGAGAVGLEPPATGSARVVNIPWTPDYEQYGWVGGHFDSTSPEFVRQFMAEHLVPASMRARPNTAAATRLARDPQAARLD